MDIDYVYFAEEVFLWINSPLVLLNLVANGFYAFCLAFPQSSGAKLKHPLKTLLMLLVWSAIAFLTYLFCMYEVAKLSSSLVLYVVSWIVVLCNVHGSIMTSALLSFYYYIQIVPLQRAFFLWVKKNIKLVVYAVLLYQTLFIFVNGLVNFVTLLSGFSSCNGTLTDSCLKNTKFSGLVSFYVLNLHFLACLLIMIVCNFSLVHYLSCHIKNVAQGGVLTTKTGRQLRVTISSVFQGVLYFVFCTFYFLGELTYRFSSDYTLGMWVMLTINTLYISGTTVNIGIGHTVFRKSAARVWRALTVRCGAGTPTNS